MTNVPQNIRDIWTEIYKLFDVFYLMEGTEDDWKRFWAEGKRIIDKNRGNKRVAEAVLLVSSWIGDRIKDGKS